MKHHNAIPLLKRGVTAAAILTFVTAQLPGCPGFPLPPIPVTIDVAQGLQISALAAASGSADVSVGAVCTLFDNSELDAMVRAEAGDLITDHVQITRVDLISTNITATDGTFDPFNTAVLDITEPGTGGETIVLGAAADNDGLGTAFSLTQDSPVDLFNDLSEDQCSDPTLHLDGAGFLEASEITFDVTMTVWVYTEVKQP